MAEHIKTILPRRIAVIFNKLFWLSTKLHKTSSNLGFVKKCLHLHLTPKFAQVQGQFATKEDQHTAERIILGSNAKKHIDLLKGIIYEHRKTANELQSITGPLLFKLLYKRILNESKDIRSKSFKTKLDKLSNLRPTYQKKNITVPYKIPVINLSSTELTRTEITQLSYGLEHSYVDKNKYVKRNLASHFESLAYSINKNIKNEEREEVHEFLRAYCDKFTKNIYATRDPTFSNLKRLRNDDSIVIIPGDKDSSVVIMDKVDYVRKLQDMIDEGIEKKVYEKSEDNTLTDLKHFQDFLYRNFSKYEHYDDMWPTSNGPAKLYGTAKNPQIQ